MELSFEKSYCSAGNNQVDDTFIEVVAILQLYYIVLGNDTEILI